MGVDEKSLPKRSLRGVDLLILVVLGTHELPFTRLVQEVERCKEKNVIQEDVIVQHGHTKYASDSLTLRPFVSYDEMHDLYDRARFIITHAGTGSVITGLRKGKKVIAAPRLKLYGEHNDDHQLELATEFAKEGYVLSWYDGEALEDAIRKIDTFKPKPFRSNKKRMFQLIEDFIDEA